MPWILCGPGEPAGQHRRGLRLHGHHAQVGVALLEPLAAAGDRAARARRPPRARRPGRRCRARSPRPSCGGGSPGWRGWRTGSGTQQSPRSRQMRRASCDRLVHAAHRLDQHTSAPYRRSRFSRSRLMPCGMREDQVVALGRADERERDAGVARGRLDDRVAARLDPALGLGDVDHRHADAVLDAAGRVVGLQLAEQLGVAVGREPREAHHRRVADEIRQVLGNCAGDRRHGHGPTVAAGRRRRYPPPQEGGAERHVVRRCRAPTAGSERRAEQPAAGQLRDGGGPVEGQRERQRPVVVERELDRLGRTAGGRHARAGRAAAS